MEASRPFSPELETKAVAGGGEGKREATAGAVGSRQSSVASVCSMLFKVNLS
jgi:hypothetical protein